MSERLKAALAGAGIGVVIFLALNGVNVLPLVLVASLIVLFTATGALHQIGGRTRVGTEIKGDTRGVPEVSFDDVGGQRTAKQELIEALEFLLHPEEIRRLGIRPLKGILFTGPPGTGKTLLAKAAANYTKSAFLAASGSEFIEMYAGVGAQRVRQLFADARALARREGRRSAIIFIDEIEVLAGRRGQHQSHLEYDQTLNQLLVEMDGLTEDEDVRVLVMAATNRPDLLDPAILRPGRLDRTVRVDLPDRDARLSILRIHTQNKPLADDVDLDAIARETFGFSGAHLESLCNEAAILALRRKKRQIGQAELLEAVDKVMLGERIDRHLGRDQLYRVAVHEGGHALVSELLKPGSVSSITIVPRGMALGFVRHAPEEDPLLQTESELLMDIMVLLAGSAAEQLVFGERSTGAANDFEKAWEIARRMVMAGLSELGVVNEEAVTQQQLYDTVQRMMREAGERVERLLADHRPELLALAERLLDSETVDGHDLRRWLRSA
jgi:cell division protease FtsH